MCLSDDLTIGLEEHENKLNASASAINGMINMEKEVRETTEEMQHVAHHRLNHHIKNIVHNEKNIHQHIFLRSQTARNENYIINSPHESIYINQSNNIFILAKYGQTVSLPCVIYRQSKNPDVMNVNIIIIIIIFY